MSTDVLSADPAKNPTYYLVEDEDHIGQDGHVPRALHVGQNPLDHGKNRGCVPRKTDGVVMELSNNLLAQTIQLHRNRVAAGLPDHVA